MATALSGWAEFFEGPTTYHGTVRAQWFFISPNHCGAFCAIIVLMLVGLYLWRRQYCNKYNIWIDAVLLLSFGISAFATVSTYSRGALLAIVLCIIWGGVTWRCITRASILVGILILILVACPQMAERSVDAVQGDGATLNRLLLWRSALLFATTGDWSPLNFDDVQWIWFQPLSMDYHYLNAVNNPITVLAQRGWAPFFCYIAISIVVINILILASKQSPWVRPLLLALLGYEIAGLFTYLHNSSVLNWTIGVIVVLGVILGIWTFVSTRQDIKRLLIRLIGIGAAATSLVLCVAILFGFGFRTGGGSDWRAVQVAGKKTSALWISSKGQFQTRVLWISGRDELPAYARQLIRPLAERGIGFDILVYDASQDDPTQSLRDALLKLDRLGERAIRNSTVLIAGRADAVAVALPGLKGIVHDPQKLIVWGDQLTDAWPCADGDFTHLLRQFDGCVRAYSSLTNLSESSQVIPASSVEFSGDDSWVAMRQGLWGLVTKF